MLTGVITKSSRDQFTLARPFREAVSTKRARKIRIYINIYLESFIGDNLRVV
jgi:hypothetical protein